MEETESRREAKVPSITVRNIPERVVQGIKKRAIRHGRSMESEVRAILEESSADRDRLMDLVEAEVGKGGRPAATRRQVDGWIRATRGRKA